ncbi:hypothetical protein BCR33DRAFT_550215 [Rhizoclosmatium globosum]|uniref:Uncharacterized protein n=1 Tax=Rhizoclosmatium globosum TaxID=329046 RepID=A0A1Y2B8K4_9FUNG|nr:hypothetical protein BCR33DRAFT_550215 [Rhizoclosmatium globosum]|eukprot:ORY31159.1 hypothetical protein BCR33DRAFT_550215 [Rhizoclosmatium globosum]
MNKVEHSCVDDYSCDGGLFGDRRKAIKETFQRNPALHQYRMPAAFIVFSSFLGSLLLLASAQVVPPGYKFHLGGWIDGEIDTPKSFNAKLGYNLACTETHLLPLPLVPFTKLKTTQHQHTRRASRFPRVSAPTRPRPLPTRIPPRGPAGSAT